MERGYVENEEGMNRILMLIIGFIAGGLIAGGVALLMAPQSGEETRRMLKENAMEAQRKASMAVDDARNRVMESVDAATSEVKERAGKVKEIGRRVGEEQASSLQRGANDAMDAMSK
jgi:gas vesicle protein